MRPRDVAAVAASLKRQMNLVRARQLIPFRRLPDASDIAFATLPLEPTWPLLVAQDQSS